MRFALNKPSATPTPPPTPPAARGFTLQDVPGLGQLPRQPGEVVLLDADKQQLRSLGWRDGDPLPPSLAEDIAKVRASVAQDLRTGQLQGVRVPVFQPPVEVPLDRLPPAQRDAIVKLLADYKQHAAARQAAGASQADFDASLAGLQPSVAAAARAAQREEPGFQVFDSSKPPPQASNPAPPQPLPSAPAAVETSACPRCGLDLRQPYRLEVDELDKANYIVAVLGQQPFRKEYTFLGGRLTCTFRDPPVAHISLLVRQIAADIDLGRPAAQAYDYRCALHLGEVKLDGVLHDVAGEVDAYVKERLDSETETEATPLPALVRAVQQQPPLTSNVLWTLFLAGAQRFRELLNHLEARADDADFLARGRGLSLLREAHFRKHLDLREARPLDRDWWRMAGWTLDWLEEQLAGEAWKLKFQLHASLLAYDLEPGTFRLHWDKAQEAQEHLRRLWLPWLDDAPSPAIAQDLKAQWRQVWGDETDPAVAERIAATAQALQARNRAGK